MDYEFHEVANIFPLMQGDEYQELVADIKSNGLLEPIWLHNNKIIDGRNRYRACQDSGVQPRFKTWESEGSLVAFVVSLNLHRRHLSSSQKAACSLDALPFFEAEAKERQRDAGGDHGNQYTGGKVAVVQKIAPVARQKARDQAAEAFQTNRQYVSDAKRIKQEAPEVFEQIKNGKKTITQAKRDMREAKREERRETNRVKVQSIREPDKVIQNIKFATILIDPHWVQGVISAFRGPGIGLFRFWPLPYHSTLLTGSQIWTHLVLLCG